MQYLRMGIGLGREESGMIVLGNLGEVHLYSKRRVRSASTDSQEVTKSLTQSTSSILACNTCIFISSTEKMPLYFLVSLVICGCKDLRAPSSTKLGKMTCCDKQCVCFSE